MSESTTVKLLPQYSCQCDFPIDFEISNYQKDLTSSKPSKPPSFWIDKYQENVKPVHGKVNVLFNNEENENPTLDAQPEFNVAWMDNNSFKLIDEQNNDIIIEAPTKNYKLQNKNINSIDISPSGAFVVTGEDNGIVKLVEISTGSIPRIFEGHIGDVTKVRFFPSGEVLLTAATDLQIKIWSVLDGSNPVTLKGHTRGITDTAIISRGRNVLSSSKDGSIRLWECGSSSTIRKVCQLDTPINNISLGEASAEYSKTMMASSSASPSLDAREVETQGKLLFASTDKYFHGYDLGHPNEKPVFCCDSFENHSYANNQKLDCISALGYSCTAHRVVTGHDNGIVAIWDLRNTSQPQSMFKRNTASITSLNIINDHELLVSQGDGQLYLCQLEEASPRIKKEYIGSDLEPWYDVSVAASSHTVLAGGRNGLLQKYRL